MMETQISQIQQMVAIFHALSVWSGLVRLMRITRQGFFGGPCKNDPLFRASHQIGTRWSRSKPQARSEERIVCE